MKLIWHIVMKDFRLLRSRLGMWAAILAAKYVLGFWLVLGADISTATFASLEGGMMGFVGTDVALTLLIAALLVQDDVPVGSLSFWMSRPISGARLLVAKILGAGLFLVAPAVVIALPWWLLCGFEPAQIGRAALEHAAFQVILVAFAMTVACLTETVARFFIWFLVTFTVMAGVVGIWVFAAWDHTPHMDSRVMVHAVIILATLAVIMGVQFVTRRRQWVPVSLCTSAGLGAWVLAYWPWDLMTPPPTEPVLAAVNPALAPDLKIEVQTRRPLIIRQPDGKSHAISLEFRARGLPAGNVLGSGTGTHRWNWPDGQAVSGAGRIHGQPPSTQAVWDLAGAREPRIDAETELALQSRKFSHLRGTLYPKVDPPGTQLLRTSVTLAPGAIRFDEATLSYQGTVTLELLRPEVWLEVPVTRGRWASAHGRGLRVMRTIREDNESAAVAIESEPLFLFDELRRGLLQLPRRRAAPLFPSGPAYMYFVANRKLAEAHVSAGSSSAFSIHLGGVKLRGRTMDVTGPRLIHGGKAAPQHRNWADDATVAIVGLPVVGAVTRDVAAPHR